MFHIIDRRPANHDGALHADPGVAGYRRGSFVPVRIEGLDHPSGRFLH